MPTKTPISDARRNSHQFLMTSFAPTNRRFRALAFPASRIEQFAVIIRDEDDRLLSIVEKPGPEDLERARDRTGRVGVSMNLWRFPYDRILPCLEEVPLHPTRLEKELPAAVLLLLRRWPRSLLAIPLEEHVPDLTDRGDILEVQRYLAREFPDFSFGGP